MRKKKLYLSVFALFFSLISVFSSCGANKAAGFTSTSFSMGSAVSSKVFCESERQAKSISGEIFSSIDALDRLISATSESSETAALNRGEEVPLSDDTLDILTKSVGIYGATGGALDVTLGALTKLWGFSSDSPSLPSEGDVEKALSTAGTDNIASTGKSYTLKNGAELDFGAVGKGAGCDKAEEILRRYDFSAVVSIGGTILLHGERPDGESWSVGIRDPKGQANDVMATLSLNTGGDALFVSTSGSYEKRFTENGKTYHHILNGKTGYPVENGLLAVTAVSKEGFISDALSTALFVMGFGEDSLELTRKYLEGAVFVFENGSVYVSDGLKDRFELTDAESYDLITDESIN